MNDLNALVAQCLADIDEDAPTFRGLCERLRSAPPDLLLNAQRFPELAVELRKLRPCALWAYGSPLDTLRAKVSMCLDGIVCPVTSGSDLPPAQGRECWLELEAENAERLLPTLPSGWGVVIRGAYHEIPWQNLRRLSRLRPLGVHLTQVPLQHSARPHPLDLVVGQRDVGYAEALSSLAPRALGWPSLGVAWASGLARIGRSGKLGLLCKTGEALDWVLRLGAQGLCPTLPT